MKLAGDTTFHPRAYPVAAAAKSSGARLRVVERADPWDAQNQQQMLQLERTGAPDLYEKFQAMREKERAEMEKRQLVDNPNVRRSLDDAIEFVGSCQQMCPVYERVRRVHQNAVKEYELRDGKISPQHAVKSFSRPAAGQPPALPSDVRPPSVLKATTDYLSTQIVPLLPSSHPFLWDRTRSVRQDFTYQNYAGPEALECIQQIVRIHILCMHVMAGEQDWSKQQELEQFNKALKTLDEFYALRVRRTLQQCPGEPEMRAYQLLSGLYDPEVALKVEALPAFVTQHRLVKLAFELRALRSVPGQLFRRLTAADVPPLIKVLCRVHFPRLRSDVLSQLRRCLNRKSRVYPAERFSKLMGFEDGELDTFCEQNKLAIQDGWVDVSGDVNATVEASKAQNLDLSGCLGPQAPLQEHEQALAAAPAPGAASGTTSGAAPPAFKAAFGSMPAPLPKVALPPIVSDDDARQLASQLLLEIVKSESRAAAENAQHKLKSDAAARAQADAQASADRKAQAAAAAAAQATARANAAAAASAEAARAKQNALFISLTEAILKTIAIEKSKAAAMAAVDAERLRKRNLKRVLVGVSRRARQALQQEQEKMRATRDVRDYEGLLRDVHSPRLAQRIVIEEPGPEAIPEAIPEANAKHEPNPETALALAIPPHTRILLVADWQSPRGQLLKQLLNLNQDYSAHTNGSVVGPCVTDPDIVINILSSRFGHYIDGTPQQLAAQLGAVLGAYEPTQFSFDTADSTATSANVTLFAPKRRLLSSVSPKPKRPQRRKASLQHLQALIKGSSQTSFS